MAKNITRCKQNRAVLFCMVLYTFFTISSIITMYNLHFIDENKGNISQIFAIIFFAELYLFLMYNCCLDCTRDARQ